MNMKCGLDQHLLLLALNLIAKYEVAYQSVINFRIH